MDTSEQKMAAATASKTMNTNNDHQDNLFMKLPAELRIDIYERIFNASLNNISEKDPLDLSLMHKAMLRTLHISRAIRYESRDICIDLANHHIKVLEFSLAVDNAARVSMPDLSEFAPSFLAGSMFESRPFYQRLAQLGETMSHKANKADALYGFLKEDESSAWGSGLRAAVQALAPHLSCSLARIKSGSCHASLTQAWIVDGLCERIRRTWKGHGCRLVVAG
jgi:hypothetical protein